MSEPDGWPQGLIDLLDELRRNGFHIGADQYISAIELALLLAPQKDLLERPDKLVLFLAPILCTSPAEQASFPKYFERWLLSNRGAFAAVADRAATPDRREPVSKLQATPRRWWPLEWLRVRRLTLPLLISVGVSLIFGAIILYQLFPRTLTVTVINGKGPVTIRFSDNSSVTSQTVPGGGGTATFSYVVADLPAKLEIEVNGSLTHQESINAPKNAIAKDLSEVQLTPLIPVSQPTINWRQVVRMLRILGSVFSVMAFFYFLYWVVKRDLKSRRRLELKRRRTTKNLKTQELRVKGAGEQLTQLLSLRRAAQELRRHRTFHSNDLDISRTIDGTVRRGLFTPSYSSRKSSPEYLVLIDRANLDDQRARLATEIMDRLAKNGVFIERYYFQGDPRLCRLDSSTARNLTLPDLAALYPEHRLMIFSDGAELFDPLTGGPRRWMEMFSPWDTRFLLSSEIRVGDYREWALRQNSFVVVPADRGGIVTLSDAMHSGAQSTGSGGAHVEPLPELLRLRPTRWTEEHPPSAEVLKQLCLQLKDFLGAEGNYWLSACAVYPKLYWDLTLYLGYKLMRPDGFDKKFSSLVRLPWFRYGSMPDWLRVVLIAGLTTEQERAVRNALEELLISSLQNPDGFVLPIAQEAEETGSNTLDGAWRKIANKAQSWRRKRFVLEHLAGDKEEATMRDHVLLDFMAGLKSDRLATTVPAELEDLFYPQQLTAFESYLLNGLLLTTAFLGVSVPILLHLKKSLAAMSQLQRSDFKAKTLPSSAAQRDERRRQETEVSATPVSVPVSSSPLPARRPPRLRIISICLFVVGLILIGMSYLLPGGIGTGAAFAFWGTLLFSFSFIRLPPVNSDDEPPMSGLKKVTGIFYRPTRVFRNLRVHPHWLAAFFVIVGINSIYSTVFVERLTPERIVEYTMDKLQESSIKPPPESMEQFRQDALQTAKQPIQRIQTVAKGCVGLFVFQSFVAALCLLGVFVFRGRINFWQAFSATLYASTPVIIIQKLVSLVILFIKAAEDIHPIMGAETLVQDNLGALFAPAAHPALFVLGSSIGILSFYGLWLRAKGLANAGSKVSSTAAWGVTIVVGILAVIVGMIFASIFPSFLS